MARRMLERFTEGVAVANACGKDDPNRAFALACTALAILRTRGDQATLVFCRNHAAEGPALLEAKDQVTQRAALGFKPLAVGSAMRLDHTPPEPDLLAFLY